MKLARPGRFRALRIALLILPPMIAGPSSEAREKKQDEFFEEERKKLELRALVDLRYAATPTEIGWLDAGLGKTRYGGDGIEGAHRFRIAQTSFVVLARPAESFTAHFHFNIDVEPEIPEGRYGIDRFRMIELFGDWRPRLGETFELRTKVGMFFPPVSLEHAGVAWSTVHTITPSAINAWVGEEMRVSGLDFGIAKVGLENEIGLGGAAFLVNDPNGSLLAYRGFSMHDRQTGFRDRLPLPPIPSIEPGGMFAAQAAWVEPVVELDDRVGYYGRFSWENYRFFSLKGIWFDSRSDPLASDGSQYAWMTRFANLGLVVFLPGEGELLAQVLDGRTHMGFQVPDAPKTVTDFRSTYVMAAKPFGRHQLTLRYDWFQTRDRDEFQAPADLSDEDGSAWTFAYQIRFASDHRLMFELLHIGGDRPGRASIGLPVDFSETIFQTSLRLVF